MEEREPQFSVQGDMGVCKCQQTRGNVYSKVCAYVGHGPCQILCMKVNGDALPGWERLHVEVSSEQSSGLWIGMSIE